MNNLDVFFSREYEDTIDEQLLERDKRYSQRNVDNYVRELLSIPISDYLLWIESNFLSNTISAKDAVQFSDFTDGTINIVNVMIEAGDTGFTFEEIGELLQNDGVKRTSVANTKYGENHSKIARYLGLVIGRDRYSYVSGVGYSFRTLTDEEQKQLLIRMFMRTPLFRFVYMLKNNDWICMRELFDMLSDSTYTRRKPNIKFVFSLLENNKDCEVDDFLNKILY